MKIAVPTANGVLCPHFGQSQNFSIFEVDEETRKITNQTVLNPPLHQPGVLPAWLSKIGCTHVIAGGMGHRASTLFEQNGIQVICGAQAISPESAVNDFLAGKLELGSNPCDHDH